MCWSVVAAEGCCTALHCLYACIWFRYSVCVIPCKHKQQQQQHGCLKTGPAVPPELL